MPTTSDSDYDEIYILAPLDFRFGDGGWTVTSVNPACRGQGQGRPLSEADVVENLRDDGWRDRDIALLIRAERLNHRAQQFICILEKLNAEQI
jgi:hypothetical protein